jgi:hypothetical protein
LVIFGVLGIAAGIIALWLPETLFSPMPQTVEQAEEWPEDYKLYCCTCRKSPLTKYTKNDEKADSELVRLEREGLNGNGELI